MLAHHILLFNNVSATGIDFQPAATSQAPKKILCNRLPPYLYDCVSLWMSMLAEGWRLLFGCRGPGWQELYLKNIASLTYLLAAIVILAANHLLGRQQFLGTV
jgi:hypothetical protein